MDSRSRFLERLKSSGSKTLKWAVTFLERPGAVKEPQGEQDEDALKVFGQCVGCWVEETQVALGYRVVKDSCYSLRPPALHILHDPED